jgi:hypothetical protein
MRFDGTEGSKPRKIELEGSMPSGNTPTRYLRTPPCDQGVNAGLF